MMYRQLIINPGSVSTKLAVYEDQVQIVQENISHDSGELSKYKRPVDQLDFRMGIIEEFLDRNGVNTSELSAVVGRGGLLPGLKTGGYLVNEDLCTALASDELCQPHASNIGGILAKMIADRNGIPAFIYDAVTSSDLPPLARITGTPDVYRQSYCHVLNSRAMAIRYAEQQKKAYKDLRIIVAHLGGGISISAHVGGKIVDTVGDDEGPFSPERCGSLPSFELIKLCYSGNYSYKEMQKKLRGLGGMFAYLGTSDCRLIEDYISKGDEKTELIFRAQAYQIAKGIGLLGAVLKGRCDAVILTGGLAYSKMLTDWIREYVEFIAPVIVLAGENEMEALALGGLRLLSGKETANIYHL